MASNSKNITVMSNGDVTVTIETQADNVMPIGEALNQAIAKGLEEIGLTCEAYAKEACPVDTGRLRASILHRVEEGGKRVQVGTHVEYAPAVELGIGQKPQPYLKPAAANHMTEWHEILKSNLSQ